MGSKIDARCPKCREFGYFYVERRKETRTSIRQIWFQIKKESPSLSNQQIKSKIFSKYGKVAKNIPRREKYQNEFRKKEVLFYVVHNVKKAGKWKTRKCYLGIYKTAKSKLLNSINNCKYDHYKLQDQCECGALLHNGILLSVDLSQLLKKN